MMKNNIRYALSILLLTASLICLSACDNTEQPAQTNTNTEAITSSTAISETSLAAENVSAKATIAAEEKTDIDDAQRKLDIVSRFTVDYNEEELEFYWGNIFVELYMYAGLHWSPQLLFKDWEEYFPVHELTLEYEDADNGTVELCFTGALVHDILMSDIYFKYYPDLTIKEKDGTEHYFKKEAIENQEVYLVGLCEGQPFGMPIDGGTGPFWVIKKEDGKAEVLCQNVVMLKTILPTWQDVPSL